MPNGLYFLFVCFVLIFSHKTTARTKAVLLSSCCACRSTQVAVHMVSTTFPARASSFFLFSKCQILPDLVLLEPDHRNLALTTCCRSSRRGAKLSRGLHASFIALRLRPVGFGSFNPSTGRAHLCKCINPIVGEHSSCSSQCRLFDPLCLWAGCKPTKLFYKAAHSVTPHRKVALIYIQMMTLVPAVCF